MTPLDIPCYIADMLVKHGKRVITKPVKLSAEEIAEITGIAKEHDRPFGYVVREFMLRGLADYREDGLLKTPTNQVTVVPLKIVGRVSAGRPIEPIENREEMFVLSTDVVGVKNPRGLRVVGDSMRESNVMDGDVILIGDCASPINRIVVAYIEEKGTLGATLKRWKQKGQSVTLEPANPDYKPITLPAKKVRWYGALIKVLRSFPLENANEQSEADAA